MCRDASEGMARGMTVLAFCCTAIFSIAGAAMAVNSIALIVTGGLGLGHCSMNTMIPVFSIVSGVFGALYTSFSSSTLRSLYRAGIGQWEGLSGVVAKVAFAVNTVIGVFLIIWTILGATWVFGETPGAGRDCLGSTYWCAYVGIILQFMCIPLSVAGSVADAAGCTDRAEERESA